MCFENLERTVWGDNGSWGTDWDIVQWISLFPEKPTHKQYNKGNKEATASAATNRPDKISPQQLGMTLQGHVWHVVYPEGAEQTPGRVSAYITYPYLCMLTHKPDTPAFCRRKTEKKWHLADHITRHVYGVPKRAVGAILRSCPPKKVKVEWRPNWAELRECNCIGSGI